MRRQPIFSFVLGAAVGAACLPPAVFALEEITDEHLSSVTAQDGLETQLNYNTVNVGKLVWDLDYLSTAPNPFTTPGYDAYLLMSNGYFTGVNAAGTAEGQPATVNLKVDVGANSQTTAPALLFDVAWSLARLRVNAVCVGTRSGGNLAACTPGTSQSFGRMALDTAVSAQVHGVNGMFDVATPGGYGRLVLTDTKAFFRQQTSEMVWKDITVDLGYTNGSAGFVPGGGGGFRFLANRFEWNLNFNIAHRGAAATPFVTTGATSLLQYGWSGGLRDFDARISPGGMWVGSEANRTEGVKISWKNNFDTDFAWIIGDPTDSAQPRAYIHFKDWVNLPGVLYTFDVPNVTFDVVRANQGPGAINYLGTNYTIQPDATALAIAVRDLKFLGHNTKVTLFDATRAAPYSTTGKDLDWGLIYTFGDLDANVFMYPGGRSASLPEGIRLDAMIAVQSPSTWTANTHFLIADTDPGKNVGLGFLNTDFLINVDNAFLEINSEGIRLAVLPLNATAGPLQNTVAAGDFSWRLNTTFGGGYMNNLAPGSAIEGFGLDLFLHANKLDLTFMPPTANTYVGFKWSANLLNDSYIKLTEPGSSAAFTIGSLSGPLAVQNGKIDLRAGGESDGYSRLAFEQELMAGRTASGVSTDVLMGQLAVGSNNIARLAVPGGIWYGGLALKEQ